MKQNIAAGCAWLRSPPYAHTTRIKYGSQHHQGGIWLVHEGQGRQVVTPSLDNLDSCCCSPASVWLMLEVNAPEMWYYLQSVVKHFSHRPWKLFSHWILVLRFPTVVLNDLSVLIRTLKCNTTCSKVCISETSKIDYRVPCCMPYLLKYRVLWLGCYD